MKKLLLLLVILLGAGFYFFKDDIAKERLAAMNAADAVKITPISHATAILEFNDVVLYTDPTGGAEAFAGKPSPTIILVTDIHGDHLSTSTLSAVIKEDTALVVPKAVGDLLPDELASRAKILNNGEFFPVQELKIEAIPMYNLPESADARHTKGRGNGYVIATEDGVRIYVAGDTAGIPEMRMLEDIDIAFVPMNLPYTMDVEEAADAVLDFRPTRVYPYHYRGQDGLADVNKFKTLVEAGDQSIEVVLLNWYPN